jgi:hypothetical protein
MIRKTTFSLAAGLLACTVPLASAWCAVQQNPRPEPLPANPPTPHQFHSQDSQQRPELKTFNGKISKSGKKFVLEDSSKKATYQLDDQQKAQQYQGKNVRITGTLDAENNLIHIQAIEEAV